MRSRTWRRLDWCVAFAGMTASELASEPDGPADSIRAAMEMAEQAPSLPIADGVQRPYTDVGEADAPADTAATTVTDPKEDRPMAAPLPRDLRDCAAGLATLENLTDNAAKVG